MKCRACGKVDGVNFDCVECCVRWLSRMKDREEIRINAPVIGIVAGAEQLEKVRQAWKERK